MEISTDKEEIKDELHELEDTQQDESEEEDEEMRMKNLKRRQNDMIWHNLGIKTPSPSHTIMSWLVIFLDHNIVRHPNFQEISLFITFIINSNYRPAMQLHSVIIWAIN